MCSVSKDCVLSPKLRTACHIIISNLERATPAQPHRQIRTRSSCPILVTGGPGRPAPISPDPGRHITCIFWPHNCEARGLRNETKKKQALGDCVFFCLPPACQEVFLVGMEMVATVLLISEERERDAHHCTFPSSSCAAPSSVEGVSCALRLLYRNAAFLRPMKIDPGYDIARPKRRTRLHISTSPPPLASLGGRIRQRPRKRITSLNDKVTTSIP